MRVYPNQAQIPAKLKYWYKGLLITMCFFFSLSGYWEITQNAITYPKTILMGYPPYFILWLGIAKLLGAVVLLLPQFKTLKEWAFAGFVFDVIFAFISGLAINSYADCGKALAGLCLILVVYTLHQCNNIEDNTPF